MSIFLTTLAAAVLAAGDAAAAPPSTPGSGWSRLDAQTLAFQGRITEESRKAFGQLIDDETTTVVLTSRGGDVEAALDIANAIHDRGLDVVVRGHCVSSCANYLFLAGRNRMIEPDSFLGFHGTLTSLDLEAQVAEMEAAARAAGQTDEEIAAQTLSMRRGVEAIRERERAFALKVGFAPDLYVDTGFERLSAEQKSSLPDGDPVFFPSAEVLAACYGVEGVVDRSRAEDSDLGTLAERAAPGLGFVVLGDEWFSHCRPRAARADDQEERIR